MGRFFTSFDEAWQFFLDRDDELEDFFARLPEQESFFLGWLIRFDQALGQAAREAQRLLSHLDWITPVPVPVLHTSLAGVSFSAQPPARDEIDAVVERAAQAWREVEPFEVGYERITCFHDAVVAEVSGNGPRALVERLVESDPARLDTYLPHVTLGVFNRPHGPAPLRAALAPLRNRSLGAQVVGEATLCLIRLSRSPILPPWEWEVVGSVRLGPLA